MTNVISYWARDPFARGNVARQVSDRADKTCDYCGQTRQRLYSYGWSPDSTMNRDYIDSKHAFCNRECYTAYNG